MNDQAGWVVELKKKKKKKSVETKSCRSSALSTKKKKQQKKKLQCSTELVACTQKATMADDFTFNVAFFPSSHAGNAGLQLAVRPGEQCSALHH